MSDVTQKENQKRRNETKTRKKRKRREERKEGRKEEKERRNDHLNVIYNCIIEAAVTSITHLYSGCHVGLNYKLNPRVGRSNEVALALPLLLIDDRTNDSECIHHLFK